MATELVLVKDRGALKPRDPYSAELLDGMASGVDMMGKLWIPRNLKQHRLVWALAQLVAATHPRLKSAEQVMTRAKLLAHMGTMTAGYDPERGRPIDIFLPKSMSFATMDQAEFARHFDPLVEAMASLIGITSAELLAEGGKQL